MRFIMAAHFSLLTTDASKNRWGTIFDSNETNGLRSISKSSEKVNVHELKTILFIVMALVNQTALQIIILF